MLDLRTTPPSAIVTSPRVTYSESDMSLNCHALGVSDTVVADFHVHKLGRLLSTDIMDNNNTLPAGHFLAVRLHNLSLGQRFAAPKLRDGYDNIYPPCPCPGPNGLVKQMSACLLKHIIGFIDCFFISSSDRPVQQPKITVACFHAFDPGVLCACPTSRPGSLAVIAVVSTRQLGDGCP